MFLLELAEEIRLFSLNADPRRAPRLRQRRDRRGRRAVKNRSDAAAPEILTLGGEIGGAVDLLTDARFRCAAARIAVEGLLDDDA